jgi:uncharacterized protein
VCGDKELSGLDRKLAELYQAAERNPATSGKEKKAQSEWLKTRNDCAKAKAAARDCLVASYQRRIAEIQIFSGALEVPKPVSFDCPGLSKDTPLTIAYYNQTDPPSGVFTYDRDQVVAIVQPSGSGAKYDAPNFEFWEHQGEALLTRKSKSYVCKPVK